jgi:hypothetical protein
MIMLVLIIAYLLAAMHRVPEQVKPVREWSQSLSSSAVASASEREERIPFFTHEQYGYVSPEGELLLRGEVLDGVAVDRSGYINYSRFDEALVKRGPRGEHLYTIQGGGIPFFRKGRLWLLAGDATGITAVAASGERLYHLDFGTVITSLDSGTDVTAVGLLDGTVQLFDASGRLMWKLGEGEAVRGTVYGVAVSPEDARVAYVHGLRPQRISLYSISPNGPVKEFERDFSGSRRSELLTAFGQDGRLLMSERDGGVWLRNLRSGVQRRVSLPGELIDYHLPGAEDPLFLASNEGGQGVLTICSVEGGVYSSERFPAEIAMLQGGPEGIYVITAEAIHKVRIECE